MANGVSQTFLTESVLLAMSWQTVYVCLLGTQKNPKNIKKKYIKKHLRTKCLVFSSQLE